MNTTIATVGGNRINFSNPEDNVYDVNDIAFALSNICRFNGHCMKFYSVAEHSVYVSRLVPDEYKLLGLFHDAAEAFMGDVTTPLKALLPEYKELEHAMEAAIYKQFGLTEIAKNYQVIKNADIQMVLTEKRDLLNNAEDWFPGYHALSLDITKPLHPEQARLLFLQEYVKLIA